MTEQPQSAEDLETMIRRLITEETMTGSATNATAAAAGPPQAFTAADMEEVLGVVDPADSDSAILMLNFLLKTGRLQRVGVLDGGQGYLFVYAEPKGATKAGYKPGGTEGDRIVDKAADKAAANGTRGKTGLCPKCYNAVVETPDGIRLDGSDQSLVCTDGQAHTLA